MYPQIGSQKQKIKIKRSHAAQYRDEQITPEFACDHITELFFDRIEHEDTIGIFYRIAGLRLSGDKRIVPIILEMLKDPEQEVQKQAIQSLGKLGDSRALPALQAIALNRRDREMYKLARQAIEELSRP